jgi:hypothetical protein
VLLQELGPTDVAELLRQVGRAFDIREEEGEDATGKAGLRIGENPRHSS